MNKMITPRLIPALIAVAFSGTASASGFQLLEQNASGLGNAYAGSAAVAENASTIFYNPAGMTELKDREISGGLTAINTSYKFTDNGSNVGALATAGNGGDGGGWGYLPNAYASWALNKDWYIGLGVGAPFGLKTEFDNPWKGGAQSLMFDIKTINVNPSIAWRVNESVSLGFGLNWQTIQADYHRQVAVLSANHAATKMLLKLDDDAWGWNIGALFKLTPKTKLGVSYRSTMKYDLKGDIKFEGPVAQLAGSTTDRGAKASLELPDTFILSLTHALNDQVELLGDLSWTGWSSIQEVAVINTETKGVGSPLSTEGLPAQTLHTKFRDTWRVALGSNYRYNDALKLKFGVAYDQTPVKGENTRLVSLPDNNRWWLSLGAQWKATKDSTLDLGVTRLFVQDSKIDNDQFSDGRGRVTGSYKATAWIIGAQYSMSF
ncbi:OmpP1/FadL family transporter [Quatrionicoccus australiensis]|uniref:OmpP1/FadL family transporter n=1 Tax=Quatrionicoccus australiensis TaxID=138118 RepID=UPI001CF8E842|nr:outer membrane protein transport protein [Quatrionicoccus australiensis]UCV13926.1 outer membrane protein transport protein [Quatrionicoccus australiensis]